MDKRLLLIVVLVPVVSMLWKVLNGVGAQNQSVALVALAGIVAVTIVWWLMD